MANTQGVKGASPRGTPLHYLSHVFLGMRKAGVQPEKHLRQLAKMANTYRDLLPPKQREALRARELTQRASFNRQLLGKDLCSQAQTPAHIRRSFRRAMRKIGYHDPLSPSQLAHIQANLSELKTARQLRAAQTALKNG
ncbi:MAG: hypothetical protein AB7H77_07650 [Bdellovibrionales bacterium]